MKPLTAGVIAGFFATLTLSLLMVAQSMIGIVPQLDVIGSLTVLINDTFNSSFGLMMGWVAHFVIGTFLWGGFFALTNSFWSSNELYKGMQFSTIAWLAMMLVFMPLVGAGLFASNLGIGVFLATLLLHLLYGMVIGHLFGKFVGSEHLEKRLRPDGYVGDHSLL